MAFAVVKSELELRTDSAERELEAYKDGRRRPRARPPPAALAAAVDGEIVKADAAMADWRRKLDTAETLEDVYGLCGGRDFWVVAPCGSSIAAGEAEELPMVIKTDVHGSLEAIRVALEKLGTDQVKVRILSASVGAISESDISLAAASNALVVGFNVRAIPQARDLAKRDGMEIRYHSIIYELIDEVKSAMGGLLSPDTQEEFIGYAEIRQVFGVSKIGKVAGCMVTEGIIKSG